MCRQLLQATLTELFALMEVFACLAKLRMTSFSHWKQCMFLSVWHGFGRACQPSLLPCLSSLEFTLHGSSCFQPAPACSLTFFLVWLSQSGKWLESTSLQQILYDFLHTWRCLHAWCFSCHVCLPTTSMHGIIIGSWCFLLGLCLSECSSQLLGSIVALQC